MSAIVGLYVAVIVGHRRPLSILACVSAPLRDTLGHEVVAIAVANERAFAVVQARQLPPVSLRHHGALGREPMDAQFAFQESEHSVHRTALCATPDEQIAAHGAVGEAFILLCWLGRSRQRGHAFVVAYDDAAATGLQVTRDGQLYPTHLTDILLQFARGGLFRAGGISRNNNLIAAFATTEEPVGGVHTNRQNQQYAKQ